MLISEVNISHSQIKENQTPIESTKSVFEGHTPSNII